MVISVIILKKCLNKYVKAITFKANECTVICPYSLVPHHLGILEGSVESHTMPKKGSGDCSTQIADVGTTSALQEHYLCELWILVNICLLLFVPSLLRVIQDCLVMRSWKTTTPPSKDHSGDNDFSSGHVNVEFCTANESLKLQLSPPPIVLHLEERCHCCGSSYIRVRVKCTHSWHDNFSGLVQGWYNEFSLHHGLNKRPKPKCKQSLKVQKWYT